MSDVKGRLETAPVAPALVGFDDPYGRESELAAWRAAQAERDGDFGLAARLYWEAAEHEEIAASRTPLDQPRVAHALTQSAASLRKKSLACAAAAGSG